MNLKKLTAIALASILLVSAAVPVASALTPHGTGILCRNWLKNDPDYQFSDAYKTSVWYENFTSLELTSNDRNNILRIAVSQLGYHEGDSAKDFDGMNKSGSSNYIEYARLLVPHYNDNAYEWCACFVNWCLNQARYDKASSEIGCWKWVGELKTMKMWQDSAAYKGTYTPQPADMIFFNWDGKNTGSGHIGYVLYTTETHVFTIEGNADNNVTVRSYALSDPRVIGYGTPPYNEGDEPTIDWSYKDGMLRGTYVVNSYNAALKKAPGATGRICSVPAGSAVTLHEVDGDYARITYGDKDGYLLKNLLFLMTPATGEDTLTFDGNGGENTPEAAKVTVNTTYTLPETTPTLEGDTFLGWSLIPYNTVPDYKAGDSLTLTGDTTLYAVWENHSAELAATAFAEGKAPLLTRPESITNSSALLLGTLTDLSVLTGKDTEIKTVTDETCGAVLSLTSTAQSDDPYITLDYAALMESLRLAPVTADKAAYAVLKVKNVSLNNTAVDLSVNGSDKAVTVLLEDGNDWQYLVFDLTEAGFAGELTSLRIDWEKAANEAGNTMLLADIFFVSTEEQVDALTHGQYIFPVQPVMEPETEAPSEPSADENADPSDTRSDTETPTEKPVGGCKASVGMTAATILAACAAFVALRKRED